MINGKLIRVSNNSDGTYGVITLNGVPVCVTLEEEWQDNQKNISCVPAGRYICCRKISPSKGEVFEIRGVPGRDNVLIHSGCTEEDTEGCVLTGRRYGTLEVKDEDSGVRRMKTAVLESKVAFADLMEKLKGFNEFPLEIVWAEEKI